MGQSRKTWITSMKLVVEALVLTKLQRIFQTSEHLTMPVLSDENKIGYSM